MLWSVFVCVVATVWGVESVRKRNDIYVAGFFPLSTSVPQGAVGRGVMPAIKLALKHINEHPYILKDYQLHLYFNDTQCSAAVGMKSFFDMMDRPPKKVSLLGGSCTSVTDPIAKTSKRFKMTLISYADTHPMFTKKNYPNFFRLVPSENALNEPRIQLLKYFNWTRVGTLYQTDPRFSLAHNRLVAELDISDIEVAESQSFVDDLSSPLGKLLEKDVRIILGNFNASWARRVFCHAHSMGIYGKRYQWIIAGPQQEEWWLEDSPSGCSSQELLTALEGVIVVEVQPLTDKQLPTISGLTSSEYASQYNSLRGGEYTRFHGYAYDALWTIALAIDTVTYRILHPNLGSGQFPLKFPPPAIRCIRNE